MVEQEQLLYPYWNQSQKLSTSVSLSIDCLIQAISPFRNGNIWFTASSMQNNNLLS